MDNNRQQRSDIFSLRAPEDVTTDYQQIYSVGGSPSGRLNRLRGTSSSVFPVGCMGTTEQSVKETEVLNDIKLEEYVHEKEEEEEKQRLLDILKKEPEAGDAEVMEAVVEDLPAKNIRRNPLTGEGMQSSDMPRAGAAPRKKADITKFNY